MINKFSLFIYLVFNNYIMFKYFFIPKMFTSYNQMTYVVIFFMFFISFLVYKIVKSNINSTILNKKYIKYSLLLYFCLNGLTTLLFTCRILLNNYIEYNSYLIFSTILILASLYLSTLKINDIVNVFTWFGLFYLIFVVIMNFSNLDIKSVDNLLPFELDILNSNYYLYGLLIFSLIDTYIYLVFFNVKKSIYFISSLVWLLIMFFEVLSVSMISSNYLNDYEFSGLISHSVMHSFKYFGNLNFMLTYFVTLSGLFKISMFFSIIKQIFSNNKSINIIYVICLFLGYFVYKYYEIFYTNLSVVYFILIVLFTPYFINITFIKGDGVGE